MEITKICFKCGLEKPISEFYKHPAMADGHLNKCKDCTKKDVKDKYEENIKNPDYVEKERARGREKYKRLGYYDACQKQKSANMKHEQKGMSRMLRSRGYDTKMKEAHHWSYDHLKSVFLIGRREHKLIHKYLVKDENIGMFYYNGELLDTKEKHRKVMEMIFEKHDIKKDIVDIDL